MNEYQGITLPHDDLVERQLAVKIVKLADTTRYLAERGVTPDFFSNPLYRSVFSFAMNVMATQKRPPIIDDLIMSGDKQLIDFAISILTEPTCENTDIAANALIELHLKRSAMKWLSSSVKYLQDKTSTIESALENMQRFVESTRKAIGTATVVGRGDWHSWTFDTSDDVFMPEWLFEFNGSGIIPRSGITALTGKAKAGKSNFLMILLAAAVSGSETLGIKANTNERILYIDTEQPKYAVLTKFRRMLRTAGLDEHDSLPAHNVILLSMRDADHKERLDIMAKAIESCNPGIVIVDGIVDLITDFNDVILSENLIARLMQLTERGISFIGVLHENDGSEKMRGHLGTMFYQKCDEKYAVEKKHGYFNVSHVGRDGDIPDFKFCIVGGKNDSRFEAWEDATPPTVETAEDYVVHLFDGKDFLSFEEVKRSLSDWFVRTGKSKKIEKVGSILFTMTDKSRNRQSNPILTYNSKTQMLRLLNNRSNNELPV